MAWRFTKVHANLIHWLISTQVMGTVEAVEKKENRVRVKWDGDDTYKHLTLREAQRLRAEDEPGEEEPEKVDAVVDIGDDDVVFVVDEEAATAEAAAVQHKTNTAYADCIVFIAEQILLFWAELFF